MLTEVKKWPFELVVVEMTRSDLPGKAEEYGMNEYSISKEMVRNGKDIIDLLIGTQIAINEGKIEVR